MQRDCNNCQNHKQGQHPATVIVDTDEYGETTCRDCLANNLVYFKPIQFVHPLDRHKRQQEIRGEPGWGGGERRSFEQPDRVLVAPETKVLDAKPDYAAISAQRKGMPLFQGVMMYFPDALLAIAEHSRKNNDKHNPGQPLHWSKGKSNDHADCVARHLIDIGPTWDAVDPESGSLHACALAWRALAILQTVIERQKESK